MRVATRGWCGVLAILVLAGAATGAPTTAQSQPAGDANALADAILDANTPAALKLLAAKPALAKTRSGDGTQLHWAVQCGNVPVVKALLAAGADVSAVDDEGAAPLHWAVRGPDADPNCVDMLVAAGAKIDAKNKEGETALIALAKDEHAQYATMVKALVKHKASLSAADKKGRTAMAMAAYEYQPAMAEALAAAGAEVDLPAAVVMGRVDLVRKYLQAPGALKPRGEGLEGYWLDVVAMATLAMEKADIAPGKPNREQAARIGKEHVELLALLDKRGVAWVEDCVWKAVSLADPAVGDWLLENKYKPTKADSVEALCRMAMANDYCAAAMLQTVRRRLGDPAERFVAEKAPKELAAWVEKLKSEDAVERVAAARQISGYAPIAGSAAEALKKAMEGSDSAFREEAAATLKAIAAGAAK